MSEIEILPFDVTHLEQLITIWNSIVAQGETFTQKEPLGMEEDRTLGFYILHPNNIERCSKIANASYGVTETARGQGIGKRLVLHSLKTQKIKVSEFCSLMQL